MKTPAHLAIISCLLAGFSCSTIASDGKESSLKTPAETCKIFGDTTVKDFGDALAKIGETPSDVRNTVNYTCLDAIKTALVAQSENEIEQWRVAKLNDLWGVNKDRDQYKSLVINTSANLAEMYYKDKNGTSTIAPSVQKEDDNLSKTINKSSKYDGTILIVNKSKQYVAVVDYNIEGAGCDTKMQDMTISEVILDKDERHVESMRFKEHQSKLNVNFNGLDNASRSWADKIFKLDDKVSVNIMICGSGGFESMIGIAKPVIKDFPAAGVQINVPN